MSREYTAAELRKMADAVLNECTDEENGLVYESRVFAGHVFYPDEAAAMLRYASDVLWRCDEVLAEVNGDTISRFDHGVNREDYDANEIVDYILRGDVVKEEK